MRGKEEEEGRWRFRSKKRGELRPSFPRPGSSRLFQDSSSSQLSMPLSQSSVFFSVSPKKSGSTSSRRSCVASTLSPSLSDSLSFFYHHLRPRTFFQLAVQPSRTSVCERLGSTRRNEHPPPALFPVLVPFLSTLARQKQTSYHSVAGEKSSKGLLLVGSFKRSKKKKRGQQPDLHKRRKSARRDEKGRRRGY